MHEVPAIAGVLEVSQLELLGRLGLDEAAEAAKLAAEPRPVTLDRDVLRQVIAGSHLWLAERRLSLTAGELADLVIALYELVNRDRNRDPDAPIDIDDYADIIAPLAKGG